MEANPISPSEEKYEAPQMETIEIQLENVILDSAGFQNPYDAQDGGFFE